MKQNFIINAFGDFFKRLSLRLYVGRRYISLRTSKGKQNIIFFTLFAGISGGLMVLIVVLSIMNGFQNNHISRRIEIGSYHLVIKKKQFDTFTLEESRDFKEKLYASIPDAEAVVPFADREIIMYRKRRRFSEKQVVKLRAVDPEELVKDTRFLQFFSITTGAPREFDTYEFEEQITAAFLDPKDRGRFEKLYRFSKARNLYLLKENLTVQEQRELWKLLRKAGFNFGLGEHAVLVGKEMGLRLLARLDDVLYLTPDISLRSGRTEGVPFLITATYATGSYLYDRYWAYISIHSLKHLTGTARLDGVGIKFSSRVNRKKAIRAVRDLLGDEYEYQTAEEINRGYFAALKLEKVMIMLLFFMIFILVAANTFGALKLTVIEKKSDILVLKAIGLSPYDVQLIFIVESLILGFGGSFTGLIMGIFVAYNISNIFLVIETIANKFLLFIEYVLEFALPGIHFDPITIYDHSIYYQSGFLVKLYFHELIVISLLIIGMTITAAFIPVLRASRVRPNSLLRKPNL